MTSYMKPTVELIGPSGEADDVSFNLVDETFVNEPTLDATIIEDSLNASPNDASANDDQTIIDDTVDDPVESKFQHDQAVEICGHLFAVLSCSVKKAPQINVHFFSFWTTPLDMLEKQFHH